MTSEKILRVTIEGNVGSGKSSFCKYLKDINSEYTIVDEPIEQWRSVNGHNLMSNALAGDDLESITNFQHFVLHSVLRAQSNVSPKHILISERCLMTQREVFWKALSAQSLMKAETYQTLDRILSQIDDPFNSRYPDVYVYLREKPEVCLQRCQTRGRIEERHFTLANFKLMERLHDSWLLYAVEEFDWAAKLIIIDCHGKDKKDMRAEALKLANTLEELYNQKQTSAEDEVHF